MPDVLAPYAVLLKSQQQVSHAKLNTLFLTPIPTPIPVLIPMLPSSPPSTKGQQKKKKQSFQVLSNNQKGWTLARPQSCRGSFRVAGIA